MDRRTRSRFRPRLEALEGRWCPSTTPYTISDFVAAQGHTHVFNTELPGLPDNIGWSTASTVSNGRFALIDYSGKDAAFLSTSYHINLGTTTSGTLTERTLADGRAKVTVELDTDNALAWACVYNPSSPPDTNSSSTPLLFGHRAQDLVNDPNLTPALANSHLQAVFIIPTPTSPLPDLVNDFILGNAPPGEELVSISFRATAPGTTPTGQQATLVVSQTGVLGRTPSLIRDFGFTAEVVDVQTHGRAPAAVTSPVAGPAVPLAAAPSSAAHASHTNSVDVVFASPLGDPLGGAL